MRLMVSLVNWFLWRSDWWITSDRISLRIWRFLEVTSANTLPLACLWREIFKDTLNSSKIRKLSSYLAQTYSGVLTKSTHSDQSKTLHWFYYNSYDQSHWNVTFPEVVCQSCFFEDSSLTGMDFQFQFRLQQNCQGYWYVCQEGRRGKFNVKCVKLAKKGIVSKKTHRKYWNAEAQQRLNISKKNYP